jgi:hypothetical protein
LIGPALLIIGISMRGGVVVGPVFLFIGHAVATRHGTTPDTAITLGIRSKADSKFSRDSADCSLDRFNLDDGIDKFSSAEWVAI